MNSFSVLSLLILAMVGGSSSLPYDPLGGPSKHTDPVLAEDSKIVNPQPPNKAEGGKHVTSEGTGKSLRTTTPKCREFCTNRYGAKLCCDDTPFNDGLTCPPSPRIDADCSNPEIFEREVNVKKCSSHNNCGPKERCCNDSCDIAVTICMPGDRNLFYLFP